MTFEDRVLRLLPHTRLLRTWELKGGISATMTAFEIEHENGVVEPLIARQPGGWAYSSECEQPARTEFEVLQMLRRANLPAPNPRVCEEKTDEIPHPFLVVDYVDGQPEIAPSDPQAFLDRYVRQLIEIHRTDVKDFAEFLPHQMYELRPVAGDMNISMREPQIRERLIIEPSNPAVLRHGDFWPGNILWRDGEIAAVIDWEEALIGEPLADLAICRLDIFWILGWDASQYLTEMYLRVTDIDSRRLPFWDLWASLRPIRNIDQWSPAYSHLGRSDITTETMIRDHQYFVEQALSACR